MITQIRYQSTIVKDWRRNSRIANRFVLFNGTDEIDKARTVLGARRLKRKHNRRFRLAAKMTPAPVVTHPLSTVDEQSAADVKPSAPGGAS